ncbi:DUF1712 domain-containing protein [archaeon]|nr:MAG: DUF1712 domain-containing protein [archaeon]
MACGCLFPAADRGAGCSDEEADITERAERLLYFFPSEVNMESQLRHVGFCEGLIQFTRYAAGHHLCALAATPSRAVPASRLRAHRAHRPPRSSPAASSRSSRRPRKV